MRRRFSRGRRRFGGRPVQRQQPLWWTQLFNETSMSVSVVTSANEFSVWDWTQSAEGAASASYTQKAHIKRIIVKGQVGFTPELTTAARDICTLYGGLYVIDREDQDESMVANTGTGTILEGGVRRLLWCDCWAFSVTELPSTVGQTTYFVGPRIDIDINPGLVVAHDEVIVLGLQWGSDVSATLATSNYSGIHRVLFTK